jgi:hypothetical protein
VIVDDQDSDDDLSSGVGRTKVRGECPPDGLRVRSDTRETTPVTVTTHYTSEKRSAPGMATSVKRSLYYNVIFCILYVIISVIDYPPYIAFYCTTSRCHIIIIAILVSVKIMTPKLDSVLIIIPNILEMLFWSNKEILN